MNIRNLSLPNLFLFFCFFTSFAVINFPSAKWGLQMSWTIAIIMLFLFPHYIGFKIRITLNNNFRYICGYWIVLIVLSIISLYLQSVNIISFQDISYDEIKSRAIPHCIYLLFEFCIYLFLVAYLSIQRNQRTAVKWFITYPFYLITFYGIYQWLTTFDIVPYTEFFNNNASTGFTYLRFKGSHRASSVFPEPSEYAYYLGFMLPFILTPFYNRLPKEAPCFFENKMLALFLYFFAVFSTGSMSLFAVLPIIFYLTSRKFIKISQKKFLIIILACIAIIGLIFFLQRNRLNDLAGGDDGSAISRFESFMLTVNLFKGSPIIGGGFGAVRGLDLLSFLLGTTGIVGTLYFVIMITKIKAVTYSNQIFKMGLICMIIVALMSNPIIDHTFFWPILAFNTVQIKFNS